MIPTVPPSSPDGRTRLSRPGRTGRGRRSGRLRGLLVAGWFATTSLAAFAGRPDDVLLRLTVAVRRRVRRLRTARDAGLTTVEVAIITGVLLGLATALVAAITVVVNRNTSRIR